MPSTSLGHGIGLRRDHYAHLLQLGPSGVDWFEVISENFFEPGGRPWAALERVRRDLPVVLHGVSMGIGNAGHVPETYLEKLSALIDRVEPPLVSDHLCWTSDAGINSHDLLPLPYTEETLERVAENVAHVQDRLGRRILLENPSSYVTFAASTIPEWELLMAIVKRTGCGLLLDVNNVYVSGKNHGFDPETYIRAIDPACVEQVHLAGHTDHGWFLLDSHIGPVPPPVWSLYRFAVQHLGPVPTLIEWDEAIPTYAEVVAESERARSIEREILSTRRGPRPEEAARV
ncbi:MAG: DUF692 domain-containing protein [Deltaproteobacteria bacterium]|nr:DUF692 domain-containing protein [Deltaproteobacteria bacterium]